MDPFDGFIQGKSVATNPGVPALEEGDNEETGYLGNAGQLLALAGNSAAFGLAPKAANLLGKIIPGDESQGLEWERKTKNYLSKASEENPVAGVAAEIVGGVLVPMPGMGLARGAGKLMQKLGGGLISQGIAKGSVGGAIAGGLQGAGREVGQQEIENAGQLGSAALEGGLSGMGYGAAFGGALGGLGGKINTVADDLRASSTGAGSDSARKAARWSLSRKPGEAWEHVKSGPLSDAEQLFTPKGERVLGGLGETADSMYHRASEVAELAGRKMESVVKHASQHKITDVDNRTLSNIFDETWKTIHDVPGAPKEYQDAAEKFLEWGIGTLRNDKYKLSDIHDMARNISTTMGGPQHSLAPADNIFNSLKKQFAHDLRELVVRQAERVPDKSLGREVAQASANFNAAATARDMAASSVPRWDLVKSSLLGKGIMQQASTVGLTYAGVNPVLARYFASVIGTPGRLANSAVWLNRVTSGRTSLPPGVQENVIKAMMRKTYNQTGNRLVKKGPERWGGKVGSMVTDTGQQED